jgi:transcription antitermination factor NusG
MAVTPRGTEWHTEGGEALTDVDRHASRESAPQAWYAIWTRSNCERLVAQQLHARRFESFLPERPLRSERRGEPSSIRVPLFPGYLFIRDTLEKRRYIDILQVRGIVRVLEDGWTRLTPVPDADIEAIQRLVEANLPLLAHASLAQGDRVRIAEGPLEGLEGVFVRDKEHKGRFVVNVNLLGRSVAVEVDGDQVVPVSPTARV